MLISSATVDEGHGARQSSSDICSSVLFVKVVNGRYVAARTRNSIYLHVDDVSAAHLGSTTSEESTKLGDGTDAPVLDLADVLFIHWVSRFK